MATTRKPQTKRPTTKKTVVESKPVEPVVVVEEKKTYADDDKILCTSITPGEYLYVGEKTKMLYSWADAGETERVRYDDLTAAIRLKKPCVFKPRIIINDEDLLAEYPEVQAVYDAMYSKEDLARILALEAPRMMTIIKQLPDGAKDAIKSMAVRAIENGTLDSVARVKALDQYFGTDMLLKLAQ